MLHPSFFNSNIHLSDEKTFLNICNFYFSSTQLEGRKWQAPFGLACQKTDRWSFCCCLGAIISRLALLHSETPQRPLLLTCTLNLWDAAAVIGLFMAPLLHYHLENITQKGNVMKSPPLQLTPSNLKWHFQELFSSDRGVEETKACFSFPSDCSQTPRESQRDSLSTSHISHIRAFSVCFCTIYTALFIHTISFFLIYILCSCPNPLP